MGSANQLSYYSLGAATALTSALSMAPQIDPEGRSKLFSLSVFVLIAGTRRRKEIEVPRKYVLGLYSPSNARLTAASASR
jgi:hypothetical protein